MIGGELSIYMVQQIITSMKAVVLAGGFGKRLRPITNEIPKPMIKINDKPIIGWQVEWLKSNGINDIVVAAGYKREHIIAYLKDGKEFSINIEYVVEEQPLDTGGGLKNASGALINEDSFLVINGDILTNLKIDALLSMKSMALAVVPLPSPFGIVEIDEEQNIRGFVEKPKITDYWINAGVYYLTSEVFDYLPDKGSIEKITFPQLAKERKLKAVKYSDVYWRAIDSHKDIEEASKDLAELRGG